MNFLIELFNYSKIHFEKKFFIIFTLVLISALLDFFAIISFIPIINILFPDTMSGSERILEFYLRFFDLLNINYNAVSLSLLIILIFFLVKLIEFFSEYYSLILTQNVKYKLQKEFLFKLKKSFLGYFVNIRIGEITNLYNREIHFVAESYRLLLIIIARLIIFFLLLIFLLINESLLTFSTLILTFLLILSMKKFYNIIENNANDLINEQKKVSSSFTFFINNIFSIKNTIYQDSHINEIKDQTENWIKYLIKNIRYKLIVSSFIEPIFIIMIIFSIFIIFQIQSVIPANYLINLGILLRFARHFLSIQNSYIKILNWKRYVKSKKFHDKLLEDFLDDQANQKENISEISEILIEKLNISYEDKTIIKNFNIKLEVPFCLKIDGKNGSGKTTLVRAIMGLIKLDNGNIKFNKSDINQLDKKTLSNKVCILDKNPLIIKGSFLDNIKFNPKSTPNKKEIINFIKLFDLSDIFNENNLEDKIIEEEGKNLSQGQMQKISVIRSLVNQYEVLILDEGLSNIDENNEKKIMKYLIQLYDEKKMNLIFISHKTNFDNYFKQKVSL
tara:strand:+ start:1030 stop:2712 length:1683 start_codon:yes stop_codon:yes gene_type:complete